LGRYLASDGVPYRAAGLSVLGSLLRVCFLLPIPLLVRHLFEGPRAGTGGVLGVGAAILSLEVAAIAAALWSRRRVLGTSTRRAASLRAEALHRLDQLSVLEHERPSTSALHDRLVTETKRVEQMTFVLLADLVPSAVIALGIAAVLAVLDRRLFLVSLLLLPLNAVALRLLGRSAQAATQRYHAGFEAFSSSVLRALHALELTRIAGAERWLEGRLRRDVDQLTASTRRNLAVADLSSGVQQGLTAATSVIVLVAGGIWVAQGRLDVATLIGFLTGLALLRGPLNTVATSLAPMIEGMEALATLEEFLEAPRSTPRGRTIDFRGHVQLAHVSFGYGERAVLEDVCLEVAPGEVVAVVGPNGVGKTTLIRLLLGLVRPRTGTVLADGVPYDELDLVELRRRMGVLTQTPILVGGTVWDNLTFGLEQVSVEAADRAMQSLSGQALLERLPDGYQTPVGEDGARLSGGEQQQIALARALLRSPRLLVLDEPTRHLDEAAVAAVVRGLRQEAPAPATLLVSHDPRVVGCADRVLELGSGRLAPRAGRGGEG
jgi:ABC-type multidrug transport system fused ATPase/permease subunit